MQILKDIGSYAGLGSVVGLAVLSALYFSQARDVKRLREWAGRAPERMAEGVSAQQITAQRVTAVPQQTRPGAAAPGQTGGQPAAAAQTAVPKPAPAATAAAGAPAAQARPAAATPAAQGKPPGAASAQAMPAAGEQDKATEDKAAEAGEAKQPAEASEPAESKEEEVAEGKEPVSAEAKQPAGVAAAAGGASGEVKSPQPTAGAGTAVPPKPADGSHSPAPAKPGGAPPTQGDGPSATSKPSTPAAARPGQAQPSAGPRKASPDRPIPSFPSRAGEGPAPSQTAIIPPYGEERAPWHRRLLASPRYLVLAIGGVLIVGGAAAFGLTELSKKEAPPPKTQPASQNDTPRKAKGHRKLAPITPSSVTVSVLNGTTVPGLAAQIGDRVGALGFQLGNVTNSSDQQRAESVVLFAPGAQREAAFVGRKLGITQREPIDPQSQGLAGDARVVIITGADKTR